MFSIPDFLYYDVLQPGDGFTVAMRKLILAVACLVCCIYPVLAFNDVLILVTVEPALGSSVLPITLLYMCAVTIASWIFVKRTRTAPTALMDFWL